MQALVLILVIVAVITISDNSNSSGSSSSSSSSTTTNNNNDNNHNNHNNYNDSSNVHNGSVYLNSVVASLLSEFGANVKDTSEPAEIATLLAFEPDLSLTLHILKTERNRPPMVKRMGAVVSFL